MSNFLVFFFFFCVFLQRRPDTMMYSYSYGGYDMCTSTYDMCVRVREVRNIRYLCCVLCFLLLSVRAQHAQLSSTAVQRT